MNQLCKVCGEPAAGFHFGAFTCEGCKSFFGRTYNNLGSITECKNNGQCVINKKNRTACKACRLRKCLLVGMSKSGSRYGRRSNWFKIHCLLQEQQQLNSTNITPSNGLYRNHPYIPFFRNPSTLSEAKSSESDSGASSVDLEEDTKSTSILSCPRTTSSPASDISSKKFPSPASDSESTFSKSLGGIFNNSTTYTTVSSLSPNTLFPRWLSPFARVGDPSTWKDFWLRSAVEVSSRTDQEEPIDLSLRRLNDDEKVNQDETEVKVNVEVEEALKQVPLDLTLGARQTNVLSN